MFKKLSMYMNTFSLYSVPAKVMIIFFFYEIFVLRDLFIDVIGNSL